ncbi:MAG: transporter substrate-binding domain-containing protein [Exilispira sp.]
MKKFLIISFIIVLFIFFLINSSIYGQNQFIDKIIVSIDQNYPPYIYRSEDGTLKGYLVDLWREWEKITKVKVVLYADEWSKALNAIMEGKTDVIDTIFYTEERSKIFSYSKPYETINVPIIYSKSISGISDYDSLKGFLVGAKEKDAAVDYLKKNGISNLILFGNYEDIIIAAKDEKIKVFTIDEPCAVYYLNKYNILENYKIGFYLYSGQFHRAVKKGNEPLLDFVEKGFSSIDKNTYKKLKNKWFGIQFEKKISYKTILLIILIIASISILYFINYMALIGLVKKRTRELQTANKEIEKEKAFLESLFKVIPDIIFVFDEKLNITLSFFPKNYEKYRDKIEKELISNFSKYLKDEQLNNKNEKNIISFQSNLNLDDQIISFDIRIIFSKENFYLLLARDISEKLIIEKNIYEKQKLEIIGTLASGLAHDINNVLHSTLSISSLIKLMLDESSLSKESLSEYAEILEKSALKGSTIVSTLLNFSKDSKGQKSNFDLKKTIENSIEIFNMKFKKKISVHFLTNLNDANIYADENNIMQIIINLLINSYESYERKDLLENAIVNIRLKRTDDFYKIEIEDFAGGIKPEIQDKIFNPFFTTKGQGRGIGIGLTVVKKIIDEHKGRIEFISKTDSGTTFSIYLPFKHLDNNKVNEYIPVLIPEDMTLLIVDDDLSVLNVTRKNFEKRFFNILTADNIEKAKKLFLENKDKIKCCIVDLVMPEMDGIQLLKFFVSNGYDGLSIISTGYKDDPRLAENKEIKIDYIIEKPYKYDTLAQLILDLSNRRNPK